MSDHAIPVAQLAPDEVRSLAKSLAKKKAKAGHWSREAEVVGRVSFEHLFEGYLDEHGASYPNAVTWAEAEMGLTRQEFSQVLDLYELLQAGRAQTPACTDDDWLPVRRSVAAHLRKIKLAGGNLKSAIGKVMGKSTEQARLLIAQAIGGTDLWTTVSLRIPVDSEEMFRAALAAVAAANPDLGIAVDADVLAPKNGFRLIECLVVDVLQKDVDLETKLRTLLKTAATTHPELGIAPDADVLAPEHIASLVGACIQSDSVGAG